MKKNSKLQETSINFQTKAKPPEIMEKHNPPKLGQYLIEIGVIKPPQLDQALEFQKANGGRLGDILISLGIVNEVDFEKIVIPARQKTPLGKMLVDEGVITKYQLEQALEFQAKSGGLLGDVLITLGMAKVGEVYRGIATQHQLGRVGNTFDFQEARKLPYTIAKKYQVCIINQNPNHYLLATVHRPSTGDVREIEAFLDLKIELVLANQHEMDEFWQVAYGTDLIDESVNRLSNEMAYNSSRETFTCLQKIVLIGMAILTLTGLIFDWRITLFIVNTIVQLLYLLISTHKMYIIMRGIGTDHQITVSDQEIRALDEKELPIYTILVPLYHEAGVIQSLLEHLEKLDYPKTKLDVRLLLEENDHETLKEIQGYPLPYYCTVLIVPQSKPQTKPKACNYGLIRARGKYAVIYDAEDRPELDQLKKAYLAFKRLPENYICVQSKLNYYNWNDNLLTKWFTHEYSMWFELLLPGISQMNIPVPLGGTSNHFKMDELKKVGAWDPFNVTEDCDLGVRIFKEGYLTAVLDSRTWEEANSKIGNWLRQRSRWIKGYMQTWLVHMRHPVKLCHEIGISGFWGIQAVILGSILLPIINPWLWILLFGWFATKAGWIAELFWGPVYYISLFLLVVGNVYFVYSNMFGMYWIIETAGKDRRRNPFFSHSVVKYALISPIYWILMSVAGYKALWQLFSDPFHWEKTHHGLSGQQYSVKSHSEMEQG